MEYGVLATVGKGKGKKKRLQAKLVCRKNNFAYL